MGMVLCVTNRAERGMEELERALAINPNLAHARAWLGFAHLYTGRADETEAHVMEALRLSPLDALVFTWFFFVGTAKAHLGMDKEALQWLRKSIDENRNFPWPFLFLASSLAHLGRLNEAKEEVKAALALAPKITIKRYLGAVDSANAVYLAQRDRVAEGMRMGGCLRSDASCVTCLATSPLISACNRNERGPYQSILKWGPD
jgi:tetratricopeptide (TPR) repeat protein